MRDHHCEQSASRIGTRIKGLTDEEQISRVEELSAIDPEWTKITRRSEYGGEVDVYKFRMQKGKHLRLRKLPLSELIMIRMEAEDNYEYAYCDECGTFVEPDEPLVWSGSHHYCMSCGKEKYSEPVLPGDDLICTRCGMDIDPDDDIWGFPEAGTRVEECMCSKCAHVTHIYPVWEHVWKQT